MRTAAIRPASLDAPIGDDESNNYSEIIADENADTPYEQLEDQTVTRMLQEMVKTLDPREATILRYVSASTAAARRRWRKWAKNSASRGARPADFKHRAEQTAQDDRAARSQAKVGKMP